MNLAIKNSEITKMSAVNPSAFTEPVGQSCEERSGGGWGTDSDFRRKLLNLGLQAAHLLERPLGQNGELLRLAGQQFPAQGGQRLVQAFQLFHCLGQDSFVLVHRRNRSSPFFKSGASRTRLKNSTYVLYNALSR